jgi:hypothetical protein
MSDKTEANARRRAEMERDECSEAYENLRAEVERLTRRARDFELNWWNAERVITVRDAENERLRARLAEAERLIVEYQRIAEGRARQSHMMPHHTIDPLANGECRCGGADNDPLHRT